MFRIHYPAGIVNPFFYIYIAAYFLGILAVNYKFAVNSNNSSARAIPEAALTRFLSLRDFLCSKKRSLSRQA